MLRAEFCREKIQRLGIDIAKAKQLNSSHSAENVEHLKRLRRAYEVEYAKALGR